jgi:hypothetical protein
MNGGYSLKIPRLTAGRPSTYVTSALSLCQGYEETGVGALLISGETVHFTLQSSSIVKLIILLRK